MARAAALLLLAALALAQAQARHGPARSLRRSKALASAVQRARRVQTLGLRPPQP